MSINIKYMILFIITLSIRINYKEKYHILDILLYYFMVFVIVFMMFRLFLVYKIIKNNITSKMIGIGHKQ